MPLTMLLASCDTNISANGVNGQKSDTAPHFNCCDSRNAVVPLIAPFASHDSDANTNVIT